MRTDVKKLIIAFHNFANVPKNSFLNFTSVLFLYNCEIHKRINNIDNQLDATIAVY